MGGVQSAVISGVTGDNAAAINGIYDKVDERCGGYRLYVKRGDDRLCIEHFEGQWQVKPVSKKGQDGCLMRVEGGCKLRECTSRVWKVWDDDGEAWNDAPSVKLVAGAAAEERAVAADNAQAAPVFISGASGDNAAVINGFFEPTEEKGLDGRVLYAKRGDASVCIEHSEGQWRIKPVSFKGKNGCRSLIAGGCGLEACTSCVWKVWDDKGKAWNDAPSVKLVAGAEAERQVRGGCLRARQHAHPPQLPAPNPLDNSPFPPPLPPPLVLCDAVCFCAGR
jgi:hypothetical protein